MYSRVVPIDEVESIWDVEREKMTSDAEGNPKRKRLLDMEREIRERVMRNGGGKGGKKSKYVVTDDKDALLAGRKERRGEKRRGRGSFVVDISF